MIPACVKLSYKKFCTKRETLTMMKQLVLQHHPLLNLVILVYRIPRILTICKPKTARVITLGKMKSQKYARQVTLVVPWQKVRVKFILTNFSFVGHDKLSAKLLKTKYCSSIVKANRIRFTFGKSRFVLSQRTLRVPTFRFTLTNVAEQ